MLPCSTDWRVPSSSLARRCGCRMPSPPTARVSRGFGRTPSLATARSCWLAWSPPATSRWSASPLLDKAGGVFVLAAGQVPAEDAVLLKAAARVVLGGGRGALAQQLERP